MAAFRMPPSCCRAACNVVALHCQVFLDHPRLLLPTLQNHISFRLPIQALHGIPQAACLMVGAGTVDHSAVTAASARC